MAAKDCLLFIALSFTQSVFSASTNGDCMFHKPKRVSTLATLAITEASGLAESRTHENVLYTHNDSGGKSRIFALNISTGSLIATIIIDNATNIDWEDIAVGPCPVKGNCIYVADVGGNTGAVSNTIYRIKEPDVLQNATVSLDSFMKFRWDQKNCETIIVNPDAEVFLVSKVDQGKAKLVQLPKSGWDSDNRVDPIKEIYLPVETPDGPTGGDMSMKGDEVLIRTYYEIFYWKVSDGDIFSAMSKNPIKLPYRCERQGESVCWDSSGKGYYTISEGWYPGIIFYERNTGCVSSAIILYAERYNLLLCLILYFLSKTLQVSK